MTFTEHQAEDKDAEHEMMMKKAYSSVEAIKAKRCYEKLI